MNPHPDLHAPPWPGLVLPLLAWAGLVVACGGAGVEDEPLPAGTEAVASGHTVLLDADAIDSPEAAAALAARERGAPGEAEPRQVLVQARRPADAQRLADELAARGFATVAVLGGADQLPR